MQYLREEFGTSMIVVSHNMGVIAQLADKIAVMYSGNIVEWGTAGEVLHSPGHPYTKALINAIPRMDGSIPKGIAGRPPEFSEKRTGCPFAPRCGKRTAVCSGRPEKIFCQRNIGLPADIWIKSESIGVCYGIVRGTGIKEKFYR